MGNSDCLFCRISAGELDAELIYETDTVIGFRDINPQAPTHVLIVPRRHISTIDDLGETDAEIVGKLFLAARDIGRQEGVTDAGYRTVMNCNAAAGQTVFHIHLHLLGGRDLSWPPG